MAEKDRKVKKSKSEVGKIDSDAPWWNDARDFDTWLDHEPATEFEAEETYFAPSISGIEGSRDRLERIKESYALLRQFTPKELKILINLKRNTSPKAWTLREDLVVLTLPKSNREIAEILKDRNKEAVKKRLQLLRSKGLSKRQPEPETPVPQ